MMKAKKALTYAGFLKKDFDALSMGWYNKGQVDGLRTGGCLHAGLSLKRSCGGGKFQLSWVPLPGLIIRSTIAWASALFASFDRSRHVLACGGGAVVNGKALLGFRSVGGLLLPTSPGVACLAVDALQAACSTAKRVLIAVVIVLAQGADGVAGMAIGDLIFPSLASWLAVVVTLLGGSKAANLLKNLAIVTGRFDGVCCAAKLFSLLFTFVLALSLLA